MQRTRKKVVAALSVGLAVVLAVYAFNLWCYFSTDSAYRRLIERHPVSREEVRRTLSGFEEVPVLNPGEMNPQIAKAMSGRMSYLRYDKFGNGGIDVVYDGSGRVVFIWPNYE